MMALEVNKKVSMYGEDDLKINTSEEHRLVLGDLFLEICGCCPGTAGIDAGFE
jgi:hypothetical protein